MRVKKLIAKARVAKAPPIPMSRRNLLAKVPAELDSVSELVQRDGKFTVGVRFVGSRVGIGEYSGLTTLGVEGTAFSLLSVSDGVD